MSHYIRQDRFSKMFTITFSLGFFLSFEAMFLLWVWNALDVHSTVSNSEFLRASLRYQILIWGIIALIQGMYVRKHTTYARIPILVWCTWTILSWAVLWSVLAVNETNPRFPILFFISLVSMGMCHWLGAAILNQGIPRMSLWR
ncbi:MAG: hypothetical protein GFH27_549327n2 [Chloroflexi bacterium AL-W]|nr:hypothetical protein [Chloroflexi bacterium AL-N1]NOK69614.1 hypothetical protein [Chloroflexi bacterium AL-N10]NOK72161.1 hypothetical protein [Chloroflexi bacterium AL-N5]NOK84990.1 hypothetical protein [Chloroflexi bacterium AL-W]NOK91743.1 hypothetical protein [Chloroflexi bacterium AL-N15]